MNDADHLPARLGRYEILAEIGQGTMGVVYKASDPVLGRLVALKVIRLPTPVLDAERTLQEQRFLREANMAGGLSHPNIVVVHDVGRDPAAETPFMALEFLEGQTLAETLAGGSQLGWREALQMTAQLADALHHAHGRGIIHRDVKPANIMLLPSGTPKILDFGIAKALAGHLTVRGQCWGTPFYMSPEQASDAPLDGRSDLFSLGSVLYELLTGQRAFDGDNVPQVVMRVVHEHPRPPSQVEPSLPPDLDFVVMRMLAKDPALRYANGRALADDIEDVLQARSLRSRACSAAVATVPASAQRGFGYPHHGVPAWPPTVALPATTTGARRFFLVHGSWGLSILLAVTLGFGARELQGPPLAMADVASAPMLDGSAAGRLVLPEPASVMPAALVAPLARPRAARTIRSIPLPFPEPVVTMPDAPAPVAVVATTRVAISVEHGFKRGVLKVWIDDTLVLEKTLSATRTKSALFFTRTKGNLAEVLDVALGKRMFRVEVEGDDDQHRGAQLTGFLREHETRLLEVKVDGRMQLGWKS